MDSSEEDFQIINQMYKRIMNEDKYLCVEAQKNLNAGAFVNGELHPRMEKGPLFFQTIVRSLVQEHYDHEKSEQREIWPARQKLPRDAVVSHKDLDFSALLSASQSQGCGAPECCLSRTMQSQA